PEPAQRPDLVDLDRAWRERSRQFRTGGDNQVIVRVRVNPTRRAELVATVLAVCDEHADAAEAAEPADADGWLRMEVAFQDPRHAEWATWQLATDAEVLTPQWLRTSLGIRAAAVAACYDVSP
nr:WYL domain-containing protein [Micromonospora sp. DSM 115978]